jgi:histidinol-phosphate/aromatic aminotransferase/cobyric acid decarboxylase-like protein/choline kinase
MQILIPAAGMGKRLGSETYDKTKAMVEVNGKTLIERCLDSAVMHPIDRIILVVGYEKEKLKSFLGNSYKGVDIIYVENNDYATTNNIYSVFLAKDYLLEADTILIESDLIFEPKILQMVVDNKSENLALVDKHKPWMDGTVVKLNDDFSISHFISKADFNYNHVHEYYKTVNIYKFSKVFLNNVYVPFLEAYAKAMGNNEYYEQVLKVIVNLDMRHLKALPLDGETWYEVDDVQDLDNANLIFAEPNERYKLLSQRYGGYWRFDDLKDFCYLVNPFFPPEALNNELKFSLNKLMQSYPSGEKVQAMLGGKLFGVPESLIVVGNGAAELIDKVTSTLKGRFGLYGPTFEEYTARFKDVDLRVPNTEGFRYGADDVIALAEDNDGVILINPDNPSGNFIPYEGVIEILEKLNSAGKYLILDESFLDFAEGGFDSSVLNTADLERFPNLVVIKSIGKSYGVGGLRLGVLASSNTDLVKEVKSNIPIWNINSIAEFYLQVIGKYTAEYQESCAKLIQARVDLLRDLRTITYLQPYESQANYILCKVISKDAGQLASDLCNKYSILIKDCSGKASIEDQYIRVAVRDTRDNESLISSLKALA